MKKAPLVMMMAGGTGGHIFPALAVAKALQAKGYRVTWLGTQAGLEARIVPAAGIHLHHLAVRGLRGKSLSSILSGAARLVWSIEQATYLMLRLRPALVVGMGGYVAAPGGVAAMLMGRPLFIHEQNAVAGSTNRWLRRIASRIFAAFEGAFNASVKAEVVGNPVRAEIAAVGQQRQAFDGQRDLHVLVLGGSQGALAINRVIPDAVAQFEATEAGYGLSVWHQVGQTHMSDVGALYAAKGITHVRISPFIEDMAAAFAWADVVVARAGALTCSELLAAACPAALVPLPIAIDDHQRKNAQHLVAAGAAIVIEQDQLTPNDLASQWAEWLRQPEVLAGMSRAAKRAAKTDATDRIVQACEEVLHGA
ncbi:MAG: undecaprenyldiphospho-muramoylpentapeptide beta-N-acetylglucosaminyltransferase [Halieaceae bacterium]|nr:undecaprenyldiphospho-muramoylpentapeptide beta-N-acetylglucosaminyltransferase [Halieaceae bacterium]